MWSKSSVAPTDTTTPGEGIAVGEPNPNGANIKEFAVTGANFTFSPAEMRVKVGDTVRITLTNAEGFHDFTLDEFKVATKQLKANEFETIEFMATKTGSFEYYCSIGSHRAQGMVGRLIVE